MNQEQWIKNRYPELEDAEDIVEKACGDEVLLNRNWVVKAMEEYMESRLQALKEEVEREIMPIAEGSDQQGLIEDVLHLITNLEDNG